MMNVFFCRKTNCCSFKLNTVFSYQVGDAVESEHSFCCLNRFYFRPYQNMTGINHITFAVDKLNNMKTIFGFNNFRDSVFSETECCIGIWFFKLTPYPESYFPTVFCTFRILGIHNCQYIKALSCQDLASYIEQFLPGFRLIILIVWWVRLYYAYLIFCRNNRKAVFRK